MFFFTLGSEVKVTALHTYVDTTDLGAVTFTSDPRVKKNIAPLPGGVSGAIFDDINPIAFEFDANGIFSADGVLRWGFDAQKMQAIPGATNGLADALTSDGQVQPMTVN